MNLDISRVKGMIFDYGGTIDTEGRHWSEVLWEGYGQCGVAVKKDEFREAYVYAERELACERHILPAHDFRDMLLIKVRIELDWLVRQGLFAPQSVDAMVEKITDYCYLYAKTCIEKARPVLEALSARYPLVLVSNFYGNIDTVLTDFGIRKYFKDIIESAVLGVRKPDPRIFEHGVKALGLRPDEVLVIGDSLRKDIQPAESLGCQVLWLKGKGWTAQEDAQFHPNTIRSLGEALSLFQ